MQIEEIIPKRGGDVITVRPEDTAETVAHLLSSNDIGCVPVRGSEGGLEGILSERDLARSFTRPGVSLRNLRVRDLMTRNIITCAPDEDISSAMKKMSSHHIRHLPVISDGELVGMISLRDVLGSQLDAVTSERNVLRDIAIMSR